MRPGAPRRGGSDWRTSPTGALVLRAGVYLVAFAPLLLVYGTRLRGLLIAPPIALAGAVATWLLLDPRRVTPRRRLLYAAAVGGVLGEVTWALGYWSVAPLVGAATLWLVLYVTSGLAEHAATDSLDRLVGSEYAVVGLMGALVVLFTQPWRA